MRLELPSANANVQVYTVADMGSNPDTGDALWVKPANAAVVVFTLIGPGGAGGAGGCVDAGTGSTPSFGGGGATGGAYTELTYAAQVLPDAAGVYVGATPVGGAGVTSGVGNQFIGGIPSVSVYNLGDFTTFAQARGGLPGVGGGNTQGAGRAATAENARGGGLFTSAAGGVAGTSVSVHGSPDNYLTPASISNGSSGPGGGGGSLSVGSVGSGGWGGAVAIFGTEGMGSPGLWTIDMDAQRPVNPGVDALPSVDRGIGVPGSGGSGGGASDTGNGGNGATGGAWGGGGGGGGATRPGFTSGAGGNGGPGIVIIATYF